MRFLTESDHCGTEATDKGLKNHWAVAIIWCLLSIFDFKNPQKGFHLNFNESYNKTVFQIWVIIVKK
jgi:hypothetical protein